MLNSKIYQDFEKELGVKPGFLSTIWEEDHWSMIIKLHALFEAVLAHVIKEKLQQPKLNRLFDLIALSDKQIGKLEFAKALDLLTSEQRGFIRELSTLRNVLVHSPRETEFDLKKYVEKMNSNKKKNFKKIFGYALSESSKFSDDIDEIMHRYPQILLIAGTCDIFLHCSVQSKISQHDKLKTATALLEYEYNKIHANAF